MPIDPQAQAFLDALAADNPPGWEELSPEQGRAAFAGLTDLFGEPPAVDYVEDRQVEGRIPVRIYSPSSDGPLPAAMFFHGGGWVLGDLNTHDTLCRHLANESGSKIISVDYRRPPEDRYPVALDDCFAATCHVAEHADAFGVHPDRLAVAGDSAGGNLAAAVAIKSRDGGGPPLHSQWLIYPVIEPQFETPSYRQFGESFGLTRAAMRWFWEQYLGSHLENADALAAPIRAASLKNLPPAHVVTAEFDVLRNEGRAYAERLREAGVPVMTKHYDSMIHGFIHFAAAFDQGRNAVRELGHAMKESLWK